jgi:hypothetical protein
LQSKHCSRGSLDLFLDELASAAEAFAFLANARVLDVAAFLAAQSGRLSLPALIAFRGIRIGLPRPATTTARG